MCPQAIHNTQFDDWHPNCLRQGCRPAQRCLHRLAALVMRRPTDHRRHVRYPLNCHVSVTWHDSNGVARSTGARGVDISKAGIRIEIAEPLPRDALIYLRAEEFGALGSAHVRHCDPHGNKYLAGLEFGALQQEMKFPEMGQADYYELLQISPNAETETIHRVFRMLVARYHPDNQETGNPELFLRLSKAYETLSDPEKRAEYDANMRNREVRPLPVFELRDFVHGVRGEMNRRLGILYLLYQRRRLQSMRPGMSVMEFESLMSFPREHLEFALWFLKDKQYIKMEENSDYSITSAGAEQLESQLPSVPVLHKLLEPPQPANESAQPTQEGDARRQAVA